MWIMTNNSYLSIVSKDCGPAARGELTRRGCFTGSGISLPSLRRRRPGWARFAFKHQLVWTFAIALDLAVDLGLDLGKFFFDFDFTLGGDGHCRLPSCEGRANRIMPLDRFPKLSQGAISYRAARSHKGVGFFDNSTE